MKHIQTAAGAALIVLLACQVPAPAVSLGPVDVHGTFSQGYMDSQNNDYIRDSEGGTFDFREYGINASWQALPDLRIGAQVFAREQGAVGNDRVYLDWAIVDYRVANEFSLKAGRIKMPYGLYNETRDVDALRTSILLPLGVYPETLRDTLGSMDGGGLHGRVDMKSAGALDYQVLFGQRVVDSEDSDMAYMFEVMGWDLKEYNGGDTLASALVWETPVEGLKAGVSYLWTEDEGKAGIQFPGMPFAINTDISSENVNATVGSLEYTLGNLVLATEYMEMWFDQKMTMPSMAPGMPAMEDVAKSEYRGWYLSGAYRVCAWYEQGVGINWQEGRQSAEAPMNDSTDVFVSARFDLTQYLMFKLEAHMIDGNQGLVAPMGTVLDEHMSMVVAKVTAYF